MGFFVRFFWTSLGLGFLFGPRRLFILSLRLCRAVRAFFRIVLARLRTLGSVANAPIAAKPPPTPPTLAIPLAIFPKREALLDLDCVLGLLVRGNSPVGFSFFLFSALSCSLVRYLGLGADLALALGLGLLVRGSSPVDFRFFLFSARSCSFVL